MFSSSLERINEELHELGLEASIVTYRESDGKYQPATAVFAHGDGWSHFYEVPDDEDLRERFDIASAIIESPQEDYSSDSFELGSCFDELKLLVEAVSESTMGDTRVFVVSEDNKSKEALVFFSSDGEDSSVYVAKL